MGETMTAENSDIIDFLIRAKEVYKKEAGSYPTAIRMNTATLNKIRATKWFLQNEPMMPLKDPTRFGDYILGMEIVVDNDVKDVQLEIRP